MKQTLENNCFGKTWKKQVWKKCVEESLIFKNTISRQNVKNCVFQQKLLQTPQNQKKNQTCLSMFCSKNDFPKKQCVQTKTSQKQTKQKTKGCLKKNFQTCCSKCVSNTQRAQFIHDNLPSPD